MVTFPLRITTHSQFTSSHYLKNRMVRLMMYCYHLISIGIINTVTNIFVFYYVTLTDNNRYTFDKISE